MFVYVLMPHNVKLIRIVAYKFQAKMSLKIPTYQNERSLYAFLLHSVNKHCQKTEQTRTNEASRYMIVSNRDDDVIRYIHGTNTKRYQNAIAHRCIRLNSAIYIKQLPITR